MRPACFLYKAETVGVDFLPIRRRDVVLVPCSNFSETTGNSLIRPEL